MRALRDRQNRHTKSGAMRYYDSLYAASENRQSKTNLISYFGYHYFIACANAAWLPDGAVSTMRLKAVRMLCGAAGIDMRGMLSAAAKMLA